MTTPDDRYRVTLCRDFVRAGEAHAFIFSGNLRANAIGEWRLDLPAGGYTLFDADANIFDIDTIILWDTARARIVYAGAILSAGTVDVGVTCITGPAGALYSLTGVDLFGILGTRIVYPDHSTEQPWTVTHDDRNNYASTVANNYILASLGTAALTSRQIPGVDLVDPRIGPLLSWEERLRPLDKVVADVCTAGGIICRATMPDPGTIRYTFASPTDRSGSAIIHDVNTDGTITFLSAKPSATRIIAGGSGDGTARLFAADDDGATGLDRLERFYNVSNLSAQASVQLAAEGERRKRAATFSVSLEATTTIPLTYPDDYDLGDTISISLNGTRYPATVDAIAFTIDSAQTVIVPVLGRATTDDLTALLREVWNPETPAGGGVA